MVRVNISSTHESLVLIDGGADTCMLGPEFHIESQSDHTVCVEGFGGTDTIVRDLPVGTGLTVIDIEGRDPIMVRVSAAIITPHKSILSSNQLCHGSVKVDDIPRKYKGKQAMWLQDDTYIPLLYKNALCYLVAKNLPHWSSAPWKCMTLLLQIGILPMKTRR